MALRAELKHQPAAADNVAKVPPDSHDPRAIAPGACDTPKRSRKFLVILVSVGALTFVGAGVALAVAALQGHHPAQSSPHADSSVAVVAVTTTSSATATSLAASASATSVPADMVALPEGSFQISGAAAHVDRFEIDRTEVTVQQWERCVSAGACSADVGTVNVKGA